MYCPDGYHFKEGKVMFKKIALVGAILVIVVVAYVIMTAAMPAVSEMTGVAANATNIEDYPGSAEFMGAADLLLYSIPGIVGLVAIIIVVRRKTD